MGAEIFIRSQARRWQISMGGGAEPPKFPKITPFCKGPPLPPYKNFLHGWGHGPPSPPQRRACPEPGSREAEGTLRDQKLGHYRSVTVATLEWHPRSKEVPHHDFALVPALLVGAIGGGESKAVDDLRQTDARHPQPHRQLTQHRSHRGSPRAGLNFAGLVEQTHIPGLTNSAFPSMVLSKRVRCD